MSLNGLTGSAGLKFGPLVVETLVKHYLERFIAQKTPTTTSDGVPKDGKQDESIPNNNLRREELLYDQAFTVVKVSFMPVFLTNHMAIHACGLRPSRALAHSSTRLLLCSVLTHSWLS